MTSPLPRTVTEAQDRYAIDPALLDDAPQHTVVRWVDGEGLYSRPGETDHSECVLCQPEASASYFSRSPQRER